MAELKDVMAYLVQTYPYKQELSKARLTKMVYLADWRSCLDRGSQLTPIQWVYNQYGPYVNDVEQAARANQEFDIQATSNYFGSPKELVSLKATVQPNLSEEEKKILNFVVESTRSLSWEQFLKLVYSTYPVMSRSQYDNLDLPALAQELKAREEAH